MKENARVSSAEERSSCDDRSVACPALVQPASAPADPDLARILEAWPELPAPIRRAMLAMIETT
jgi:hypothetical protein